MQQRKMGERKESWGVQQGEWKETGKTACSFVCFRSVATHNPPNQQVYLDMVLSMAFSVSIFFLLLGILHLGFVVNFVSSPVLKGYATGAAIVTSGLVPFFLSHLLSCFFASNFCGCIWLVISLCVQGCDGGFCSENYISHFCLILLFGFKSFSFLIVTVIAIIFGSSLTVSDRLGIPVVGFVLPSFFSCFFLVLICPLHHSLPFLFLRHIPFGIPAPYFPDLVYLDWSLIESSVVVALIGFIESISVGKTHALEHKYDMPPNQEMRMCLCFLLSLSCAVFDSVPLSSHLSFWLSSE